MKSRFQVSAAFCLMVLPLSVFRMANAQVKIPRTIDVSFPNYSFSAAAASLRMLDLRNSEVIFFDENGMQDFHARLRRGAYQKRHKIGGDSVGFGWLRLIGNGSSEPDYVVAYYTWVTWAGSSGYFCVVQLLRIEEGHLKIIQQIVFNIRGSEKAGAFYNTKSNALTIRGLSDWEHCCPTGLDVVQFQLKDGVLKPVHYGKAPLE